MSNPQQQVNPMDTLHSKVVNVLENNFVDEVQDLGNGQLKCMDHANNMAVAYIVFYSLGGIVAFAESYFGTQYLAFAAGCLVSIGLALNGLSHYSESQSRYRESMLQYSLTSGYQFLNKFITNPLSLPVQPEPQMPDPSTDLEAQNQPSQPSQPVVATPQKTKTSVAQQPLSLTQTESKSASPLVVPNITISSSDASH